MIFGVSFLRRTQILLVGPADCAGKFFMFFNVDLFEKKIYHKPLHAFRSTPTSILHWQQLTHINLWKERTHTSHTHAH